MASDGSPHPLLPALAGLARHYGEQRRGRTIYALKPALVGGLGAQQNPANWAGPSRVG